jgi:hypothetical protein
MMVVACGQDRNSLPDYRDFSIEFVRALCERDYARAYTMTSESYRQRYTLDAMREGFETFVPQGYVTDPPWIGITMEDWPDKQRRDLGWAYVNVGGYNAEAVTVTVALENGEPKVREAEVGRP